MLLDGLGHLVDPFFWLLEFLGRGLVGWRFLLSPTFRQAVLQRWRNTSGTGIALDVAGGVVGIAVTALIAWWIVPLMA
jgi:hypothetical protein